MTTANIVIGILLIVMALFLVVAVLMQNGKDHRLSGSIAGGAETFFGKTKGKSLDAKFAKATTIITILFVILVLVLYIMQPEVDLDALMNETVNNAEVTDTVEAEDDAVVDETITDEAADETATADDAVEATDEASEEVTGQELDIEVDLSAETEPVADPAATTDAE